MNEVSACLIFRDCAAYLEEWLLFHLAAGVEHFYLYDNDSADDWRAVVAPFAAAGLVTVVPFPGPCRQAECYDHCLRAAGGGTEWLAFIDDDEFLFALDERGQPQDLAKFLSGFPEVAGVTANWLLFGSSGREHREPGPLLADFVRRHPAPTHQVKCIMRPRWTERSKTIGHEFFTREGRTVVDELGRAVTGPLHENPTAQRLRMHHYLVKSWSEFRIRRARPYADTGRPTPHPEAQWREWDRGWNDCEDRTALLLRPSMATWAARLGVPPSAAAPPPA